MISKSQNDANYHGKILTKSSQLVFLKEYSTETKMFNVGQGIGITLKRTKKIYLKNSCSEDKMYIFM